ncbi:NnrU family protein [Roseicyclus sp. F158]|uniref:NnrU family protein n=1 Tax=Tropicimonas omnivorans TaxID=3075590 RepID=A0ABU3DDE4_9RHOB|nr:NnrU family protein [Roseicyclus sp. F158]MDT0681740.1 NnrU family protein [Roseicyclus sp. F158]
MFLLVLGVLLWILPHFYVRFVRRSRPEPSGPAKGLIAAGIVAGIVLMVIGYQRAAFTPVYAPLPGMGHLNNLLMLVAIFLLGAGHMKGRVAHYMRHPMLTAVILWSVAHLLVNGDAASLVLFGGIGLWAVAEIVALNASGPWARPPKGPVRRDLMNVAGTVVLYALIAAIHVWLGHNPFLGTYG